MESAIREELNTFINRTAGQAIAAVVVRRDGLPVAAIAPGIDVKLVSALAALSLGSLRRMGEELKMGSSRGVVAYFENRLVVFWPVRDLYVVVLSPAEANLGLLMLELERLAKRLGEIL
ncbi:roadblock/LC7 domain-containing protein [Pyrobaculum aerophilum]|nr:dynein regulation protein LC7 [Pyrobaculum aerophilum]